MNRPATSVYNAILARADTTHNLLSSQHLDATPASVVRGDMIVGVGAAPNTKWTRVAAGAAGTYWSGGTDPAWATLNQAAVAGLTTDSSPSFVAINLGANAIAPKTQLLPLDWYANYSLLQVYPASGTNVNSTLGICPRGTGVTGNIAQILVYGTDYTADNVNYELGGIRCTGTSVILGSGKHGTGTERPFMIAAGYLTDGTTNANQLHLTTTGYVGVNCIPLTRFQVKAGTNVNLGSQVGVADAAAFRIAAYNDAGNANIGIELGGSYVNVASGKLGIGTATFGTGATYNIALGGGATSPVLGAKASDLVSLAGGDHAMQGQTAAGNRCFGIRPEIGDGFWFGKDRIDWEAATGILSIAATDVLTMTATTAVFVGTVQATGFKVGSNQVVGAQGAAVANPTGGVVVDAECRAQLAAFLARARTHGLIAT